MFYISGFQTVHRDKFWYIKGIANRKSFGTADLYVYWFIEDWYGQATAFHKFLYKMVHIYGKSIV